jgi:hypothetical protein
MSEELDLCSICEKGYLRPTGEVTVRGESAREYKGIGSRRIFKCEDCGQRQVRVANHEYVKVADDVKTELSQGH